MIVHHYGTEALRNIGVHIGAETVATARAAGMQADDGSIGGVTIASIDVNDAELTTVGRLAHIDVERMLADATERAQTAYGREPIGLAASLTTALAFALGSGIPMIRGTWDVMASPDSPDVYALTLGRVPLLVVSADRDALALAVVAMGEADEVAVTDALLLQVDDALALAAMEAEFYAEGGELQ